MSWTIRMYGKETLRINKSAETLRINKEIRIGWNSEWNQHGVEPVPLIIVKLSLSSKNRKVVVDVTKFQPSRLNMIIFLVCSRCISKAKNNETNGYKYANEKWNAIKNKCPLFKFLIEFFYTFFIPLNSLELVYNNRSYWAMFFGIIQTVYFGNKKSYSGHFILRVVHHSVWPIRMTFMDAFRSLISTKVLFLHCW